MDEAFSALDPLIRKEMQNELIQLQNNVRRTIVFITHDLDEALKIGDRIALMKDGAIVQIGTPEEILMNPASNYVEKFVEDVDRSRVLTAEMVMKKPIAVVTFPKDGPRVALRRMRENGISSIFAVDNRFRLQGIVMAEDALEAVEQNQKDLTQILNRDISTVKPDTILKDLFSLLSGKNLPLAVVDNDNRLLGIIVRGTVMAKLAEGRGN
jgi:glycine betaine/proline transport system ATP-binding protein